MGILFQMLLIIFSSFVFLKPLLKLPSLRKLNFVIIQNFLSAHFCRNYRNLLGIQHRLQRIHPRHFLYFTINLINFLIDMRHFELYQSVRVNSLQSPGSQKVFEKLLKLKMSFFTLAIGKDTNFIEIKYCYFLVLVKETIIIPTLNLILII